MEPAPAPSDLQLIDRAVEGDLASFDGLMHRHQRAVYLAAFGFTRQREDALDLAQTVFLKAFRRLRSFRGASSFRTWLLSIAAHEGINWMKRTRRHRAGREGLEEAAGAVADPGPDGAASVLAQEEWARVERGLARLHGRYRAALELRYFGELPLKEIAGALDCSEAVVKNLLFRGVRSLREALAEGP